MGGVAQGQDGECAGVTIGVEFSALYRERMTFRFMNFVVAFVGAIAAIMLGMLVYHITVRPIGGEPGLGWVFLLEGLIMSGVALFVYNFRALDVILTYDSLIIGFGRFRRVVAWSEVESFRVVTERAYLSHGGMSVRLGRSGWQSTYTVIGKPRIELRLRTGRIRELAFSTNDHEAVAKVMEGRLGRGALRSP